MVMTVEKGNAKLRPRARIIKTIGEELISNDVVAIMELVKNSYDADAKEVKIIFAGEVFTRGDAKDKDFIIRKGQGSITIEDDGSGMILETIKKGWMEPATIIKKIKSKSNGERRLLGEKGVGRFASARLSQKLEMITRVKDDNEIFAVFNWDDFGDDKYLDEVDCSWEVRNPQRIKEHGTILALNNLHLDWDYEKLRGLRTALSRLINPVAPVKDFKIELIVPKEFSDLGGEVSSPASLGKPDYKISGNVDTAGFASLTYVSRKKNVTEEIKKQLVLKPSRNPQCGTFDFELRVWDRDDLKELAEELKSSLRDIKKDLNEAAGISIYRDSFRVLPYGEPKNDWLRLDMRRVNNPTMRLSNNQIVGYVSVSLDNNKDLRDQSDREGIIESQAFLDFQEIIVSVISELEDKRYRERPRREEASTKDGIFAGITIAPVIEMVAKKLPDDKEAKEVVEETDRRIKEGVKKAQDVIARYRRLSTLGQLIDTVLHDGSGVLLKIETGALLLEKELKKETVDETVLKNNLELIKRERNVLAELFRRLEPFGGRKRGRPKEIVLEKAINDIFAIHATEIETNKIKVTLPSGNTVVKIDEAEFDMILVNLLQNSLYWLETVSARERQIFVSLSQDEDGLSLIFSDNGPGVSEDIAPFIFDPYYSKKPNGIGLGLTHVGEIVTEYDGTLELIDGGPLDGATFKITFRRRV